MVYSARVFARWGVYVNVGHGLGWLAWLFVDLTATAAETANNLSVAVDAISLSVAQVINANHYYAFAVAMQTRYIAAKIILNLCGLLLGGHCFTTQFQVREALIRFRPWGL